MTAAARPAAPAKKRDLHPFERLTPQAVLDALDAVGLHGDGRLLQLNSYENRVFQVFLEPTRSDGPNRPPPEDVSLPGIDRPSARHRGTVVAKFYRPERWSDAQIAEEHGFALELAAAEVPVVAPLVLAADAAQGSIDAQLPGTPATWAKVTLGAQPLRLAVYPCLTGHRPELDDPQTLRWLGRFIARLHEVGARKPFAVRRTLDASTFGQAARERLLRLDSIPPAQRAPWCSACDAALSGVDEAFADAGAMQLLRLHGDCHPGNILWRDAGDGAGPHFVDLDDACMGPAVQDLWMLLSGAPDAMRRQMALVLAGYRQIRCFDTRELALIEALRTLRMIHHSAWLAERWSDPAFPPAFPFFGTAGYWDQQATELREQVEAMARPPLDMDWLD